MAAITGEIGSKGQLNHRKVQSREEKLEAPACLLLQDFTSLPCFIHEEEEEEEAYL